MYQINFKQPCHLHFIGIGGISMSAFAELLHSFGFTISGSDKNRSPITEHLESLGMKIYVGQRASNITEDIDCVVYTAAISEDNEELKEVRNRNIPTLTRGQMVGACTTNYANTIAISGTHGKTSTTSILSVILLEAGLDPTINVGGMLNTINGNLRIGKSDTLLIEACEYTNSFLNFHPKRAAILNIDEDHLDFFKDLDDIRNSFHQFAKLLPFDGQLLINGDIPKLSELTSDLSCQVFTFGIAKEQASISNYDYAAANVVFDEHGHGSYDLYEKGKLLGKIELSLIGTHNVMNSLADIGIALQMNISFDIISSALKHYTGVNRRFQYKGSIGDVAIYDDYAHHPTAIKVTLEAAKRLPHNKIWCVFQPHTYSRTYELFDQFVDALTNADEIVLVDIYAAREKNIYGISSEDLQKKLADLGKKAYYFASFDEAEIFLLKNCINGDMLITMGAGDVQIIGEVLLGQ